VERLPEGGAFSHTLLPPVAELIDIVRKVRPRLSPGILQALASLGAGLKDLRRRRRVPMATAADRVLISRSTLYKVERGDPGVSLGIYATVLQGYGMVERLAVMAEARFDFEGLRLETARLPRRISRAGRELHGALGSRAGDRE